MEGTQIESRVIVDSVQLDSSAVDRFVTVHAERGGRFCVTIAPSNYELTQLFELSTLRDFFTAGLVLCGDA